MRAVCPEITFETKCYENDWEYLLKTKYLGKMISNCNFNFSCKNIIINNVKKRNIVEYYAQKKVEDKTIDAYYFVDDYIEKALNFFDIKKESFGIGYYYSSAELVGLYVAKSKYLLHFSSDSFIPNKEKSNWLTEACSIFEERQDIIVANPVWNYKFNEAKNEANGKTMNNFYIGYGFSDQCYLVKTTDFRARIYNYKHFLSERYPKYGGELFEKRIDSYMRVNEKQRITSNKESYIHKNFPHKGLSKIIVSLLIWGNMYFFYYKLKHKAYIKEKIKPILKAIEAALKQK